MKIEKITITSEDIEVLEDALSCAELSWRDQLKTRSLRRGRSKAGDSEDPKA